MATAAKKTPQDMPPKGGYANFNFARIPLRPLVSGRTCIAAFTAWTATMMYLRYRDLKVLEREKFELLGANLAVWPLLEAERDRAILKTLRRNRDKEGEVMGVFKEWVVGTLFGDPIYKTVEKDTWVEPTLFELYAFANVKDYNIRCIQHLTV